MWGGIQAVNILHWHGRRDSGFLPAVSSLHLERGGVGKEPGGTWAPGIHKHGSLWSTSWRDFQASLVVVLAFSFISGEI